MAVAARFIERAEVPKTGFGPELPATFEPCLLLAAGRFDGSRTNGPSSPSHLLVMHPPSMVLKVVLFPSNFLADFSYSPPDPSNLAQGFLLLAVAQLMAQGLDPP